MIRRRVRGAGSPVSHVTCCPVTNRCNFVNRARPVHFAAEDFSGELSCLASLQRFKGCLLSTASGVNSLIDVLRKFMAFRMRTVTNNIYH
jgi:hypothetical protein